MGRGRKIYVGKRVYKERQLEKVWQLRLIDTEPELRESIESDGVVAETIRERGLAFEDWDTGRAEVNAAQVKAEVRVLRGAIVDMRRSSRRYIEERAMEENRGLTKRQELNAINREYRARAQAVEVAARAGGVKLTDADKRTLRQVKKNFLKAVWGENNEHAQGKISKSGGKWSGGSYKDPSAKARAQENADRLAEYRGKINRPSTKPSINPFSRNYQRPAVSNPTGMSYPPTPRVDYYGYEPPSVEF